MKYDFTTVYDRHGALARVLADRLGGGMLVAVEQDVGPDFVGDDGHIVGAVDFSHSTQTNALSYLIPIVEGSANHGSSHVCSPFELML